VLFVGLRGQQKQLEQQITGKLSQLQIVNQQVERIVADSTRDPDVVQRARLDELRKQYADLEIAASDITRGLVSPREMTRLVHSMLRQHGGLTLTRVENLPPEPVAAAGTPPAASDKPAAIPNTTPPAPALYRHGLRIEVQGRFPDIVRYLRSLEQLSWRVAWGEVKMTTEHYPTSVVSFTLYTLSLDKAWIGV
jgi:MSHA biogenesis protein MshJ